MVEKNQLNLTDMTEAEFIEAIGFRFPYQDFDKCRSLIKLGASISANAAFMVLHEICRTPHKHSVSREILFELLTI